MTSLRGNKGTKLNTMPVVDQLTPTQARIWAMHKDGKNNAEIAGELGIKAASVYRQLHTAKEKLELR